MIPVPRYAIGSRVFVPHHEVKNKAVQCPECLGEKFWKVTTPTGDKFDLPCGGCAGAYGLEGNGTVTELSYIAYAIELTIGSVRIDTHDDRGQVSYMCVETGIGSGSIYYESRLFDDRAGAERMANHDGAEMLKAIQKRNDETAEKELKRAKRRPSLDKRKIKELEKEVKALQKELKT